jgi:hypothetical protein
MSFASAALVLVVSQRAEAFERQWHAGVGAGYANLFGDHGSSGFGGGAHLAYGLTDAFNLVLDVDVTHHPSADTNVWSSGAGVAYTLDVARIVPYAGLLVAGYKLSGDLSKFAPGGQLALGVDYQLDRHWAAGLDLRMHTIFAADPVGTLAYATTFLRAEYLWGF